MCEPSGTWCSSSQGSHRKLKVGQICEECRVKRQQQEGEGEETAVPRTDTIQRSAYGSLFVCSSFPFFLFSFFVSFFFLLFFLSFCHFFFLCFKSLPLFCIPVRSWSQQNSGRKVGRMERWSYIENGMSGCLNASLSRLVLARVWNWRTWWTAGVGFIECMLCKLTRLIIQHKCQYKYVNSWFM